MTPLSEPLEQVPTAQSSTRLSRENAKVDSCGVYHMFSCHCATRLCWGLRGAVVCHHSSAPPLQCTTTPVHHHPGAPPPRCTTTPVHHHPGAPPPRCTTTPVHHHPGAPPPRCTTTPVHHHPSAPPPQCTTTPVHHHPSAPPPQYKHLCAGRVLCALLNGLVCSCHMTLCADIRVLLGDQAAEWPGGCVTGGRCSRLVCQCVYKSRQPV